MSADIRNQQRWLVTVVALLVILLIVVVIGLVRSIPARGSDPQIGHRSPAAKLAYCNPGDTMLCIVSFGQIEGGDMQVNFQLPSTIYPPFDLVINRYGVESTYECQRTKGYLGGVTCSGPSQVPGEILQFKVIARKGGILVAEGKFAIIGIAISTPEDLLTPTETALYTETPTGTPTLIATQSLATLPALPTDILPTEEFTTPAPPTTYPDTTYP
jgi:hypothetical protein